MFNKPDNKNKIIAALAVVCVILAIAVVVLLSQNNKADNDAGAGTAANSESVESSENVVSTEDELKAMEGFEIETPYCTLYYPSKWQEQVVVDKQEGDAYKVQFSAKLEGKEQIHLFDIVFEGEDGFALGKLKREDGSFITVNAFFGEDIVDESWTEEEKNTIYAMQEDINYIIVMLKDVEGFQMAE